MKIGIFGTGMVGKTIGTKLQSLGHDVMLGTRNVAETVSRSGPGVYGNLPFSAWHREHPDIKLGAFAEAAAHGEVLINATAGTVSLEVLRAAGAENLNGKILMDISNPLDYSKGRPPTLAVCNTDSVGEQIQRAFPLVKVVKTLNTMNCNVMVNPGQVAGGDHDVFVSGDDAQARATVAQYLKEWFGWQRVVDLGGIATARGAEMVLPLWLHLMGTLQSPLFNFKVAR